jgi:hypothetical protein
MIRILISPLAPGPSAFLFAGGTDLRSGAMWYSTSVRGQAELALSGEMRMKQKRFE